MALYMRGVPVGVIENGRERTLTTRMLAAEVLAAAGGPQALKGPAGADGAPGADGVDGVDGAPGADGADGVGVPPGGTTGQVLAKSGSADYATGWVAAPTAPASGGAATTAALRRLGNGSGEAAAGAGAVGFVKHDSDGSAQRPTGYGLVVWIGRARPTLGQAGDIWIGS